MYIALFKLGSEGRTRYYTIHNRQGNLFTPFSLTVQWGSSPASGREKLIILNTGKELDERIRLLLRLRFRNGYRVLYSYFRAEESHYVSSEPTGASESVVAS